MNTLAEAGAGWTGAQADTEILAREDLFGLGKLDPSPPIIISGRWAVDREFSFRVLFLLAQERPQMVRLAMASRLPWSVCHLTLARTISCEFDARVAEVISGL